MLLGYTLNNMTLLAWRWQWVTGDDTVIEVGTCDGTWRYFRVRLL